MESKNDQKVIIITGGNKGIGYGIAELYLDNKDYADKQIIITSRDINLGNAAVEKLLTKCPDAKGHLSVLQLDVTNQSSINNFEKEIKSKYKKIDVLYNNAGVCIRDDSENREERLKHYESVFNTNVIGVINLTEILLPLIAEDGHIINVSSKLGIAKLNDQEKANALLEAKDLDVLYKFQKEYEESYLNNTLEKDGWKYSVGDIKSMGVYPISKQFLNSYSKILAKRFKEQGKRIAVNPVSPGWCKTDMGTDYAPKTYIEGSETPYFVSKFSNNDNNGKFYDELKETSYFEY